MGRWRRFFTVGWHLMDACLRPVGRALVEAGSLWVCAPPLYPRPEEAGRADEPDERGEPMAGEPVFPRAEGPPPAHPERLRPDIPLTAVELALQAQLVDPF